MPPIDALALPALPAPFWFIEFFKVLGFTLHAVPMNLWYAGVILGVTLSVFGSQPARRWSARMFLQMPIVIAAGINLGIVPLLFLQVAYSRAFYPATILMAWFWFGVIVLLIPAYYGVYLYVSGLRGEAGGMTRVKRAAGWGSAAFFLAIGFLFANAMSLTTNTAGWAELWERHNVGAATTGTALNLGDGTLWPRWLLMFGLALITTAAWSVFDAVWLAKGESEEYRRWVQQFATRLAIAGAIASTVFGAWYVFGTWRKEVFDAMFSSPWIVLTLLTGAMAWLPPLLLWLGRTKNLTHAGVAAIAAAQVGVLAVNAVSRQVVQNLELQGFFQPGVSAQPVQTDWGPLVLFLATFVLGVGVLAWMFAQLRKVGPETTA